MYIIVDFSPDFHNPFHFDNTQSGTFFAISYIKLQDAYASEANKVGTWQLIGYVAPGASKAGDDGSTTNFTYTGSVTAAADIAEFSKDGAWKAQNNVALNDCVKDQGYWSIKVEDASNGNSLKYTATTSCSALTPSFENIGK